MTALIPVLCFSFLLTAFSEKLAFWRNPKSTFLHDESFITEPLTWWDAAGEGCGDDGVLLSRENIDDDLGIDMTHSEKYWIGALETYTAWIWTEDNSSLFVLNGSLNASVKQLFTSVEEISDNAPYQCYRRCKRASIGLQGKKCYCLTSSPPSTRHIDDVKCPGSFYQFCGSADVMSVYNIDLPKDLKFDNLEDVTCGYLYGKHNFISDNYFELRCDKSCDSELYYTCPEKRYDGDDDDCENGVCLSTERATWNISMSKCDDQLYKLTDDVTKDITNLISNRFGLLERKREYWVGLKRYRKFKWTDGIDFEEMFQNENSNSLKCVYMLLSETGQRKFGFLDCNKELRAICLTKKRITTTSTKTSTQRPQSTVTVDQSTMYTVNTRRTSTSSTVTPASRAESHNAEYISGQVTAVAVGGVIVFLVGVVVVVIWMRSKKRCCFKWLKSYDISSNVELQSVGTSRETQHMDEYAQPMKSRKVATSTASDENTYYNVAMASTETPDYILHVYQLAASPGTNLQADRLNMTSFSNDYEPEHSLDERSKTSLQASNVKTTNLDNVYELAASSDERSTATFQADNVNITSSDNVYELPVSPDYISKTHHQADHFYKTNPDDDYELAVSPDSNHEPSVSAEHFNKTSGQDDYEAVSTGSDVRYENPKDFLSEDYDTFSGEKNTGDLGETYSHIADVVVNDDLYNTTERKPREHGDDYLYNHMNRDELLQDEIT